MNISYEAACANAPGHFEVQEAVGPSFTSEHGDLNADSSWEKGSGIRISLDTANRSYTIDEVRKFAQDLNIMLDIIEGN